MQADVHLRSASRSDTCNRAGDVISALQLRKGQLQDMQEAAGVTRLVFHVPTRGLIGFKGVFTTLTRGEGILSHAFLVRCCCCCCCRPCET